MIRTYQGDQTNRRIIGRLSRRIRGQEFFFFFFFIVYNVLVGYRHREAGVLGI